VLLDLELPPPTRSAPLHISKITDVLIWKESDAKKEIEMADPEKNSERPVNPTDIPAKKKGLQLFSTSPMNILREAIKAVPQLKWALGVLGLVAAVAIVASFKISFRVAFIGAVIMLVLMVALVVFAALTSAKGALRIAATVMMFAFLTLIIATATFLFTSVFFKWPLDLQDWVTGTKRPVLTPTPTPTPSPPDSASIVLREGRTLESAIEDVAELDDFRARIDNCSRPFMNSVIRGGPVRAENVEKLIEQLQFRINKPKTPESYTVVRKEHEQTYDIHCNPN
jgi:hypothetical protein